MSLIQPDVVTNLLPCRYPSMEKQRGLAATALWAVALSLMAYGTFGVTDLPEGGGVLRDWGLFVGLVAAVFTGWTILCRALAEQEVSVEHIAEVVDALHDAKRDMSRLH